MIINFLQSRAPRILPTLHRKPHERRPDAQGNVPVFADNLETLQGWGDANKESIGELLFGFFRHYGHEMDYESNVVSVREGGLVSKQSKKWHQSQNRLCVEEPFNTVRNLGNTADDTSFRGVHLELRRAFEMISKGKLDECCDSYIFPAFEEKIWTKPTPQPLPILSRSRSQSNRSNKSNASTGNSTTKSSGSKHRGSNASNRRASSAAASHKSAYPSPLLAGNFPTNDPNQIHDLLFHNYQLLQAQEAQLRFQMQAQKAQLHPNGKVPAHLRGQLPSMPKSQQAGGEGFRRNSNVEPPPLSAPLRSLQSYYHPTQQTMNRPFASSTSNSASPNVTNPPSPLIGADRTLVSDMRQGIRRSSTVDNSSAPARSRSQPPLPANFVGGSRPLRTHPPLPTQAAIHGGLLGYPSLQEYQRAWVEQQRHAEIAAARMHAAESPRLVPVPFPAEAMMEERYAQDYIGYYLDHNSQPQAYRGFYHYSPNIGPYIEPGARVNGFSPSMNRVRAEATSRSPSPSHLVRSRDRSASFYSQSSGPSVPRALQPSTNGLPTSTGPVIVDGSEDALDSTPPPGPQSYAVPSSEAASLSDDPAIDTPRTVSAATPSQASSDAFATDPSAEGRMTSSMPNMLQFGDFPARAAVRGGHSPSGDKGKAVERLPNHAESRANGYKESPTGLGIDITSVKLKELPTPTRTSSSSSTAGKGTPTVTDATVASSIKPAPLLSPVREVRTPSPTTARSAAAVAAGRSAAGSAPDSPSHTRTRSLSSKGKVSSPLAITTAQKAGKGKASEQPVPQSNGTSPITTASQSRSPTVSSPHPQGARSPVSASVLASSPVQPQISGWQQSVSKKSRHKKKASVSGNGVVPGSEEEERKGG